MTWDDEHASMRWNSGRIAGTGEGWDGRPLVPPVWGQGAFPPVMDEGMDRKTEWDREEGKRYSWQDSPYPPVLFPPKRAKDRRWLVLILQGISVFTTLSLFTIMALVSLYAGTTMSGDEAFVSVLLMFVLFISFIFQALSMFFVHRKTHFSLALTGAVFGLYLFPVCAPMLVLLMRQRRFFSNPYEP